MVFSSIVFIFTFLPIVILAYYVAPVRIRNFILLLAECTSTEQAELVRQAAEKRVDTQKQSFEGYGPEQVQQLNDSVIQVEDTYVLFAVTDQAREVKDVFLKALYPGILP